MRKLSADDLVRAALLIPVGVVLALFLLWAFGWLVAWLALSAFTMLVVGLATKGVVEPVVERMFDLLFWVYSKLCRLLGLGLIDEPLDAESMRALEAESRQALTNRQGVLDAGSRRTCVDSGVRSGTGSDLSGLKTGDRIVHKNWGGGRIDTVHCWIGKGEPEWAASVYFDSVGLKALLLGAAPLDRL